MWLGSHFWHRLRLSDHFWLKTWLNGLFWHRIQFSARLWHTCDWSLLWNWRSLLNCWSLLLDWSSLLQICFGCKLHCLSCWLLISSINCSCIAGYYFRWLALHFLGLSSLFACTYSVLFGLAKRFLSHILFLLLWRWLIVLLD